MQDRELPGTPSELMAEAAREEANRVTVLRHYIGAISVLRRHKDWSFRDIAVWLSARGVRCDHNEVYRAWQKWGPQ